MPEPGSNEYAALVVERRDVGTGAVDTVTIDEAVSAIFAGTGLEGGYSPAALAYLLANGVGMAFAPYLYRVRKPDA